MDSRDFCFWLQGICETSKHSPTEGQWETIKDHLNLVFKHDSSDEESAEESTETSKEVTHPIPSPRMSTTMSPNPRMYLPRICLK